MNSKLSPIKGHLPEWIVEDKELTTALAHAATLEEWKNPTLWIVKAQDPCIVLGSSEREKPFIDFSYLEKESLSITSRRSGGGAVLVVPDDLLWVDIFIPRTSPLWEEDVKRSALWIGEVWLKAMQSISVSGTMHTESMERSPLSDLVCFAGKAPGEIFLNGRKIVGISQRRSRQGTRYQCALVLKWEPKHLVNAFKAAPVANIAQRIQSCGTNADCGRQDAIDALMKQLSIR